MKKEINRLDEKKMSLSSPIEALSADSLPNVVDIPSITEVLDRFTFNNSQRQPSFFSDPLSDAKFEINSILAMQGLSAVELVELVYNDVLFLLSKTSLIFEAFVAADLLTSDGAMPEPIALAVTLEKLNGCTLPEPQ